MGRKEGRNVRRKWRKMRETVKKLGVSVQEK